MNIPVHVTITGKSFRIIKQTENRIEKNGNDWN